ncbi:MAG: TolB family protein [Acetanaerobacterium sp.]
MNVLIEPQTRQERDVVSILEEINIKTLERTVLAEFDYLIEAPNWTKDGTKLIYNSWGRIYSFDIASRQSKPIDTAFAVQSNNDHVLSPDCMQIAISHRTAEDGLSRIYRLPLSGGNPVLITAMAPSFLHGWSPDGKTLAYSGQRNGKFNIFAIPAVGGVEVALTDAPGLNDGSEYSPCGKYIWFNSTRSGFMQLWRMNENGANPVLMSQSESNDWFPHISPDGKWVSYISYSRDDVKPDEHPPNKSVRLQLMPSGGGRSILLTDIFGGQGTMNVNSWSPDSKSLAFVSYRLKARSGGYK